MHSLNIHTSFHILLIILQDKQDDLIKDDWHKLIEEHNVQLVKFSFS